MKAHQPAARHHLSARRQFAIHDERLPVSDRADGTVDIAPAHRRRRCLPAAGLAVGDDHQRSVDGDRALPHRPVAVDVHVR